MDRARQERRIGILVVVLVLLVVVLFWMLHPHLPFSSYGHEARIKSTLESIHPLGDDHLGAIQTVNLSSGDLWVTRTNSTMSLCTALEAHYKEEFARHGFTYTGTREASETAGRLLSFSSQDYGASLSCTEPENSLMGSYKTYRISMWPNSSD
jgi:hypothetical protein